MKGSIEVSKFNLSLGNFKIKLELGWLFCFIVLVLSSVFLVVRFGAANAIQEAQYAVCSEQQRKNAEVDELTNTPVEERFDIGKMCLSNKKPTLSIMFDTNAWQYRDVYDKNGNQKVKL